MKSSLIPSAAFLAALAVASPSLGASAQSDAAGSHDSRRAVLAELAAQAGAVELPRVSAVDADAPSEPSAKDLARFDFLKKRRLEKEGLPPEAGDTADQSKWGPRPAPWEDLERRRASLFDGRFGRGTYDAVIRFSRDCLDKDGCERLVTADLISAAYRFIDLEKDVESGAVVRGSQAYRSRDEELKTEMREAVEEFRPKAGARKEYGDAFAAFADPILDEISIKP